jgi:hypothetical protein
MNRAPLLALCLLACIVSSSTQGDKPRPIAELLQTTERLQAFYSYLVNANLKSIPGTSITGTGWQETARPAGDASRQGNLEAAAATCQQVVDSRAWAGPCRKPSPLQMLWHAPRHPVPKQMHVLSPPFAAVFAPDNAGLPKGVSDPKVLQQFILDSVVPEPLKVADLKSKSSVTTAGGTVLVIKVEGGEGLAGMLFVSRVGCSLEATSLLQRRKMHTSGMQALPLLLLQLP